MNRLSLVSRHLSSSINSIRTMTTNASSSSATAAYLYNHVMLRVKDPKISIPYYEKNFGMEVLSQHAFTPLGFTVYYLGIKNAENKNKEWYQREGLLELTHNYGTEKDESFKANDGNKDPYRGFGHICFSVDNLEAACDRLEKSGVAFQKKLTDGRQKEIAFVLDADGYWIEIVQNQSLAAAKVAGKTDVATYLFHHSMIRVKDPKISLDFYQNVMGMKLLETRVHDAAKFNLYFLGYPTKNDDIQSSREAIVELTWNYGTESDPDFKYHDGNSEPQGFGHFGIVVPDVQQALDRFESLGVRIKKRLNDGKMNFIGFILDPDGYWIEILPGAPLPDNL